MENENIKAEISSLKDYYKLFNLIRKKIRNTQITIIIKRDFLEPFDILFLTQSVIYFKNNDCKVAISSSDTIKNYLNKIEFKNFCSKNYKEPSTIDFISSYTAMPIRRVSQENMVDYINKTQSYFSNICENKELGVLNICLSELINNVYNHSHSSIGAYVFSQFYHKSNEIKFAVSDLGIGIPESINSYLSSKSKSLLSKKDCVKWALKENNTTQSIPRNMGKGLDTVNSFVKSNKGVLKLFTDGVRINKYANGVNNYLDNEIFNQVGTLIQITIKVENLENSEIIDHFDW